MPKQGYFLIRQAIGNSKSIDFGESEISLQGMLLMRGLPGAVGVVEEGALAEPFLAEGSPPGDISLVAGPNKYSVLILKNGHLPQRTRSSDQSAENINGS